MFKCVHEHCQFGPNGKKAFKHNRYLNYHLKNVHGKRENHCGKCRQKFALKWQLKQHEKDCGRSFKCVTCGHSYERWLTLSMHCRRKKHLLPENPFSVSSSSSKPSKCSVGQASKSSKIPEALTCNSQPSSSMSFASGRTMLYIIPVIQTPTVNHSAQRYIATRSIATDTDDLHIVSGTAAGASMQNSSSVAFGIPRMAKMTTTQTQTTLISEYDSNELLIRDQFLPVSSSTNNYSTSQTSTNTYKCISVQTERTNCLQNSQTQTISAEVDKMDRLNNCVAIQSDALMGGQSIGIGQSINQATQFDAYNYWDLEFIDNQTQTVWNLDRHTQTDIEHLYDLS